jgi:flagellar protein FlaJ
MNIKKAYRNLGMSPNKYILTFALPLIIMGFVFVWTVSYFYPDTLKISVSRIGLCLFPVFCIIVAIIYPIVKAQKEEKEINENIGLFITRMGALATTNLKRKELIRIIAETKEYGALSEEMMRIHNLMHIWNYTLPEAARYIAKTTPSILFSDFLERMAHSLDSGEDFKSFLEKEQKVVMVEYTAKYRESIKKLDDIKEIFTAMVISISFLIIFAFFVPLFMPGNVMFILMGSVSAFIVVEVILLAYIKTAMPKDELWHSLPRRPKACRIVRIIIVPTMLLCVFLFFFSNSLKLPLLVAVSVSFAPLIIPSIIIKAAEEKVERCEDSYSAFVRAVGSSVEATGGTLESALARLQRHDFGPLTRFIHELYKRLLTRIDTMKAWHYMGADTGSTLISKFNDMYSEGIELGGEHKTVGNIVTNNFVQSTILKKERYMASASFNGVLYGLCFSLVFVLSMGVAVMGNINDLFASINVGAEIPLTIPLLSGKLDVHFAQLASTIIIISHALCSSVLTKIISGRHILTPLMHFVFMVWISTGVFMIGTFILSRLITI